MTAVSKNANTAPNREYALRSLVVASGTGRFTSAIATVKRPVPVRRHAYF
jgi:hypothetical protein